MNKLLSLLFLGLGFTTATFAADLVTHFPMEADMFGRLTDSKSNAKINLYGKHTTENMPGATGKALRFDGYSTFATGNLESELPQGAMTIGVWVAPQTYPIIIEDTPVNTKAGIVGTINNDTHEGWQIGIGQTGKYAFDIYTGTGWLATVEADDKIPTYEWSHIVATVNPETKTISLYRNGVKTGENTADILSSINNGSSDITIGKTSGSAPKGGYYLDTFNGLIDEVEIFNGLLSDADIAAYKAESEPDLSIPESRFATDYLRPKFHPIPSANWTNETHGMVFSDGKYHIFFQKNANGPYMTRLHWGHLTSTDLMNWIEEPIALEPGEEYDIKGCWSGCVFTDPEITSGLPNAIYTGVDYEKAYIVQAAPTDASLLDWNKLGVIINGRPAGLSDDFRDPYFFRNGNDAYIIVGTAKDGIGATTLHKYNPSTKTWSNDGKIFFAGTSKADHGTFWEMPNITPLGNGKWLFTTTPQNTSKGVHAIYWIGTINEDGTFKPEHETPGDLELVNGMGYGLLSPTIYNIDGKTIMLGIVPDKLATNVNCDLGWAHFYSLPREISLDEAGNLVQKPYSGLTALRNKEGFSEGDFVLEGTKTLTDIGGSTIEVDGRFIVGDNPFGFNLFKNGSNQVKVVYSPADNRLQVITSTLPRTENDSRSFNGVYPAILPEKPEPGSEMKLNIFVDGSIMDIFVNDKWATSIRIFPKSSEQGGVEVFAENGPVNVKSVNGWNLVGSSYTSSSSDDNPWSGSTGIEEILDNLPEFVDVYNLNGVIVKRKVPSAEIFSNLSKGIYIINGHKIAL